MLCGQFMNNFDRAMNLLDEKYNFLSSSKQIVSFTSETDKVGLMFFNPFFHF
jgi:1,4-alpha-glucan branching enzyme